MSSALDPLTGRMAGGSPEECMTASGAVSMARFYGLPSLTGGMASASAVVGWQSAFEDTLTGLTIVYAGPDAVVGPGLMENATVCDPAELVLGAEIWSAVAHTARRLDVSDDALAVDTIVKVGPRGHFLATKHSMTHARRMWRPRVIPRTRVDHKAGDPTVERARRLGWSLAHRHRPEPLAPAVAGALKEIAAAG